MTQYRTLNPLGSMAPKDMYDNAQNIDNWSNGEEPFYEDRFGVMRRSFSGMNFEFEAAQTGRNAAFDSSQADKESRFQAFLVSSGYVSKGDYTAGVVLEERNEYVNVTASTTGTVAGQYRPGANASVPLTLTGDWALDEPTLTLIGDNSLRQELANGTDFLVDAAVVDYSPETTYPDGTAGAAIAGLSAELRTQTSTICPTALRIAFHYNYEDAPEKLERLKALGFNVVWVYRSAPWMGDIARTNAFLDSLYHHGVFAILQPDSTVIAQGQANATYSTEIAWVAGVAAHPAVIGFTTFDEPGTQQVAPTLQQAYYDQIKAVTAKTVFCVDGTHTWQEQDAYLWTSGYDVSVLDVYAHKEATEDGFKKYFVRAMFNMLGYDGAPDPVNKRASRQSIPVLGMFSGEGFPVPTTQQMDWYVDCWRPFTTGEGYAVFAHDIPLPGYDTVDNNAGLRDLCSRVFSRWGQRGDFRYTLIRPNSYMMARDYVGSTNVKVSNLFSSPGRSIISAAADGRMSVTVRVAVAPGARKLVMFSKFFNRQDATSRGAGVEVSLNGSAYVLGGSTTVGAANNGDDLLFVYDLPPNVDAVYARFYVDTGAGSLPGYIGLGLVGAVAI